MSLIVTVDVTGAPVAINPDQVEGLKVAAGVTPAACFVRTATEAWVLPGTIAAVASLLAGAGSAGAVLINVKGSSGATNFLSAGATALGITSTRQSAGLYELLITVGAGFPVGSVALVVNTFGAICRIATAQQTDALTIEVSTFDAAGAAADGDFTLEIVGTLVAP